MKCVIEESTVNTIEREKMLECVHKTVNTCHYGYVTKFKNHRVEECHDNYEKKCSISYKQELVKSSFEIHFESHEIYRKDTEHLYHAFVYSIIIYYGTGRHKSKFIYIRFLKQQF